MWGAWAIARELMALTPEARALVREVIKAVKYGRMSAAEKNAHDAVEAQKLYKKGRAFFK